MSISSKFNDSLAVKKFFLNLMLLHDLASLEWKQIWIYGIFWLIEHRALISLTFVCQQHTCNCAYKAKMYSCIETSTIVGQLNCKIQFIGFNEAKNQKLNFGCQAEKPLKQIKVVKWLHVNISTKRMQKLLIIELKYPALWRCIKIASFNEKTFLSSAAYCWFMKNNCLIILIASVEANRLRIHHLIEPPKSQLFHFFISSFPVIIIIWLFTRKL